MFSPSLICETSEFSIGSLPSTTMTSADFSYATRSAETSPGKGIFLLPIPAVSTDKRLLVTDLVKLCSLILFRQPSIPFLFVSTGVCSLASFSTCLAANHLATY